MEELFLLCPHEINRKKIQKPIRFGIYISGLLNLYTYKTQYNKTQVFLQQTSYKSFSRIQVLLWQVSRWMTFKKNR